MDYCFRLCYVKVLGSLQDKNEKSKQQKNPVSISFQFICPRRCIYRFLFLLKNATSKFQIIRQSILTQLRPQLLTPTMQRNTKISLWQHSDRQGGGGGGGGEDSLQMRRMRRIRLDMRGRLQNRHKSHIKPLSPRNRNRQWGVRFDGKETGDLAHHGLACLGPGGELGGCDALFEAEENCFFVSSGRG